MTHRIGVDLGGTKIEAILMNETGEIELTKRSKTPPSYPELLARINQLILELDEEANAVCPVGFGTPGAWLPHKKVMKNCNNTCMTGKPFLLDMQRILRRPVRIANDADCFALSEAIGGSGKGFNSVFGVILGTGVGGGWVINQKLVLGPNALTGEWGHNPLPKFKQDAHTHDLESRLEDRPCNCGQTNCVETFLSGPGLSRTHQELTNLATPNDQLDLSSEGQETLNLYAAMLARSLASVINIMDPEIIVLGGGVSNIPMLYKHLPSLIERYAFETEGLSKIVPADYGDSSGSRGAAWLF